MLATVVLQLVGERRLSLEHPMERRLPGMVRGYGNNRRRITVRQLLQHGGWSDYISDAPPRTSRGNASRPP
ncbi:beta-lactamase family protein [Streptomyces torulosus]|uniref:beta-lactamase family protein n=1 Tax=Streptomyces torulosus TaxID=68276 RepID=UPI000B17208B|nr:beta-lactamase family protein [Streptomyces torulosus]